MDERRMLELVKRRAAARERIAANLNKQLIRSWRDMDPEERYSDEKVGEFARQAGQLTQAARKASAGATDRYLRLALDDLDAEPPRRTVQVLDEPRGIPWELEFERPAKVYRRARVEGLDELEAMTRAEDRLERLAEADVSMASRDAARNVLVDAKRVTGFRRVIHPEMSAGGTCGLCLVASDRVYRKSDLLDIHSLCKCEVMPIVGESDPGAALNGADLAEIYRVAGSTDAAQLKRVRIVTFEHGELGPVLRAKGQHVRGPAEVAADTGVSEAAAAAAA